MTSDMEIWDKRACTPNQTFGSGRQAPVDGCIYCTFILALFDIARRPHGYADQRLRLLVFIQIFTAV